MLKFGASSALNPPLDEIERDPSWYAPNNTHVGVMYSLHDPSGEYHMHWGKGNKLPLFPLVNPTKF